MNFEEFKDLTGVNPENINGWDWETIQYVYTWYPGIGKKDIAALYLMPAGMQIIRDMEQTAKKAQAVGDEIRNIMDELDKLEDRKSELLSKKIALLKKLEDPTLLAGVTVD